MQSTALILTLALPLTLALGTYAHAAPAASDAPFTGV